MENFVLYHEIYKRDGMTMYKGRKKGTITYVAISCIDKGERIKVTNHVRLVYELEHKHVVKFYEWYETSNHLWLVTELCVGGTLKQILQQDSCLPESAVRVFGWHLVRAVHHMHCNELIFVNWHPSKIFLAGDGSLKFFDFSDSRKMNEDPQDLVQRFFSTLNLDQSEIDELFACRPVCEYSAPEVVQGGPPGPATDIWSLGCVMYEMLTGSPPFSDEDPQKLCHGILNGPLIIPRTHSASAQFGDLLQRMLAKQPSSRISMLEICSHPFWGGALDDIAGPCPAFTSPTPPRTPHVPVSVTDDTSTSTVDDVSFTLHLGSRQQSEGRTVMGPQFEVEPQSLACVLEPDQQHLIVVAMATSKSAPSRPQSEEYAKMVKDGRLKYDSKLLAVPPYSAAKWRTLRKADRDKHLKQIDGLFKSGEKGPPSQRRLHLINYLAQICMCAEVSNHVVDSGLSLELCRQLKTSSNQELLSRVCQALAIVYHYSTSPSEPQEVSTLYGEVATILADLLRDQFRSPRVKLPCVMALGEGLLKLAQLPAGSPDTAVQLPVTLLNKCLYRTEEVAVSLAAARAVEAMAQYGSSTVTRQLVSAETMQQLYAGYKHATVDVLKTSAITALCRLNRIDPTLFGGLVEKIGFQGFLDNLQLGLLAVQEGVLEMFLLSLLCQGSSASVRKLLQDGVFLTSSMRLLETTSPIVRAKALLLVLLLCQADIALLRVATEHKLVLYLEREVKRSSSLPEEQSTVTEQCVGFLTAFLATSAVPTVLQDCCSALSSVQGRKHPSSLHTKSLRRALPLLDSVVSIVSSSLVRPAVLSSASFCQSLATLLFHAQLVDSGQTVLGTDMAPQFLTQVVSLVEAACHCPDLDLLVSSLLVPLAKLTHSASSADLRIIGLKLCTDMVLQVDADSEAALALVTEAVEGCLLPLGQQFFLDADPSAVYLLRLLRHYLTLNTESCVAAMRTHGLAQRIVQLLTEHQSSVMAATVLESLLCVSVVAAVSQQTLRELVLDGDLTAVLCEVVLEIGDLYHKDDRCQRSPKTTELFQAGMDALYALCRLVSDVVRTALQAKRRGDQEDVSGILTREAEDLLAVGKPLTEAVDLLVFTVGNDGADSEVGETATRLLNQVVSLYGGQQIQHGVREANLRSLCLAVGDASVKQRRTLLRVLKRLLASGHCPPAGAVAVRQMVVSMTSAKDQDAACQALLDEIAKCLDKL